MPCHNTNGRGFEVLTATPKTDGIAVKEMRRRLSKSIVVRNKRICLIPALLRVPQSKLKNLSPPLRHQEFDSGRLRKQNSKLWLCRDPEHVNTERDHFAQPPREPFHVDRRSSLGFQSTQPSTATNLLPLFTTSSQFPTVLVNIHGERFPSQPQGR